MDMNSNNNVQQINNSVSNNIKEKNNKFNIFVIILIILVLVLGGYLVYDNFIKNNADDKKQENSNKNNEENNNENNEQTGSAYEVLFGGDSSSNGKINDIKLGENKVDIEVKENTDQDILYIENKKVLDAKNIIDVFKFNDVVMAYYSACMVTRCLYISAYDYEGNEVYKKAPFNDNGLAIGSVKLQNKSQYASYIKNNRNYYVKDGKIYVYTTKIADYTGKSVYSLSDICDSVYRTQRNISAATKAEFLYEIDYLGNYKFSEPLEIESMTLETFIKECQ